MEQASLRWTSSKRLADNNDVKRAARAEMFIHMGELSSARQALVGEVVAPGNQVVYKQVTDGLHNREIRCPMRSCISSRRSVSISMRTRSVGTSGHGMSREHLRPLQEDVRGMKLFQIWLLFLPKHKIPETATQLIRVGRLTALSTPEGRVQGIMVGDVDMWWRARWRSSCRKQWKWQLRFCHTRCPPKQGVSAWPTLSKV